MPLPRRRGPARDPAPRPPAPFIVGVGRSGTTLLRLMLDAHPRLAIPPETQFMRKVMRRAAKGENSVAQMHDAIAGNRRWEDFGLDADALRARLEALPQPLSAADTMRAFFGLYAEKVGKARWGDKSTSYLTRMPKIEAALPEACFIHIIRDARDVALSQMAAYFGAQTAAEAGEKWARRLRAGRHGGAKVSRYLEVRYEALVGDPEPVLREICEFAQLEWDPAVLDYHRQAPARMQELNHDFQRRQGKGTVSGERRMELHALTARPPQAGRAGRWRTEMEPADVAAIEAVAGDLLSELGYPLAAPASAPS